MDILLYPGAFSLLIWIATIPARSYEKKTGKKLGRGAAGAGLHAINEVFQPSQANASEVIEEQRNSRIAKPAAGAKDLDTLIAEHVSNKTSSRE